MHTHPQSRSLCGAVVWLLLVCATPSSTAADVVHELTEGRFILDPSESVPASSRSWQPVVLPDLWHSSRPGVTGVGWYRFRVSPAVAPTGLWAVHLPRVSRDATVFVNGNQIAASARRPRTEAWNRPLYFPFSSALLGAGHNEIAVRVVTYGSAGEVLSSVEVGPEELLRGRLAVADVATGRRRSVQ